MNTPPGVPILLYDRKRAAQALSISIRALDYLIARKQLITRRLGRKIMIPYSELVRFAKADHPEPLSNGESDLPT